jgi:hypothetical protein
MKIRWTRKVWYRYNSIDALISVFAIKRDYEQINDTVIDKQLH